MVSTKFLSVALALCVVAPTLLSGQTRTTRVESLVIDDNNGNTITLEAPSTGMTGNWTFILPANQGTAGQVLTTDGTGGFSWAAPAGGGGAIPAGYIILGNTATPPAGFSAAGTVVKGGTDIWVPKAPFALYHSDAAVGSVGGKIYLTGGSDNSGNRISTHQEYDPATNSWSTKASMSGARRHAVSAGVGTKLYVIGGYDAGSNVLSITEEYDPAGNSWTTKAPMPTARRNSVAVVAGGKIYVIGGRTNNGGSSVYTTKNEEYDPIANTWATKATAPTALREMGGAESGGKVYTFGGSGSGGSTTATSEYTPSTNAWATKTPMPLSSNADATSLSGKIYVIIGGGTHFRYDPPSDSFEVLKTGTVDAQPGGGYVTVSSRLFVVGLSNALFEYIPPVPQYLFSKD